MTSIVLGFILVVSVIVSLLSLYLVDLTMLGNDKERISLLLLKLTSVSGIILWFWMIIHLLRNSLVKFKKIWLISFMVLNVLAAVPYFLFVYFPYRKSLHRK